MAVIIYVVLLFIASLVGAALIYRFYHRRVDRRFFVQALPASVVFLTLLAAVFGIVPPSGHISFFLAGCWATLGLAAVPCPKPRFAFEWLLCSVAGLFLLPAQLAFPSVFAYVAFYMGFTFFWAAMIEAFRIMDRVPFLSLITLGATGLGIFILGFLFRLLPADMGIIALGIVSSALGIMIAVNTLFRSGSFGPMASSLLGFIWGGFLYALASRGFITAALVWPSYYIMEIAVAGGMTLWLTHRFKCEVPFRIENALRIMSAKQAYRQVFVVQMLIALLLIVAMTQNIHLPLLIVALAGFLLFHTYSFFNGAIPKRIRYRDIVKDMRAGATAFKDEVLHLRAPVKTKKTTPPKKSKPRRKAVKKKARKK